MVERVCCSFKFSSRSKWDQYYRKFPKYRISVYLIFKLGIHQFYVLLFVFQAQPNTEGWHQPTYSSRRLSGTRRLEVDHQQVGGRLRPVEVPQVRTRTDRPIRLAQQMEKQFVIKEIHFSDSKWLRREVIRVSQVYWAWCWSFKRSSHLNKFLRP